MKPNVLIDSIVRQVTVLIAELSTSFGIRAPVSHIANDMFLQLARELEAQGVSRKVSADMFGMALRAYVRKVRRLSEGQSEPGTTLSQAVLDFVRDGGMVARGSVYRRFRRDDELSVASVLRDLCESGLVFASGGGEHTIYRAATEEELGELAKITSDEGLDEMAWVLVHREGPLRDAELAARVSRTLEALAPVLDRLIADGRVRRRSDGRLEATDFVIPLGASAGWEAGVFDHFRAVVQTIRQRLRSRNDAAAAVVGGSTYTFDVGAGHPLASEVKGQLAALRAQLGELRRRVEEHNRTHGLPSSYEQVVVYLGQHVLERAEDDAIEDEGAAQSAREVQEREQDNGEDGSDGSK